MSNVSEGTGPDETLANPDGQLDVQKIYEEEYNKVLGGDGAAPPPTEQEAPKEEVTPESTEQPKEEVKPPDNLAWLDTLPEEAKQRFEEVLREHAALQNNYKAVTNRLAPTQRRLAEAQRRLQELTSTTPNPVTQGDASDTKPKADGTAKDELWERIRESDPVLAEAIEAQLKRERAALAQEMEQRLRPLQERTRDDDLRTEVQTLTQLVPNAVEVFQSPDFNGWLDAQPPTVQKMFESSDHRDALALLRLFDADVARFESQHPAQQVNPKASEVAEKRQSRLANPLPVAGKPAASPSQELDPEAYFKKVMTEELKRTSYPYTR
jgi:hypothetical protein